MHGKIAIVVVLGLLAACGDDSGGGASGAGGSTSGAGGSSAGSGAAGTAATAPTCAKYCSLGVGGLCTGALQVYADAAACQTGCAMIKTLGAVTDTAGNTLGCRIYHLGVAQSNATMAMTHCLHGKVDSAVCK
jgi:hypothetical protein